jgi:hypothetical protein
MGSPVTILSSSPRSFRIVCCRGWANRFDLTGTASSWPKTQTAMVYGGAGQCNTAKGWVAGTVNITATQGAGSNVTFTVTMTYVGWLWPRHDGLDTKGLVA